MNSLYESVQAKWYRNWYIPICIIKIITPFHIYEMIINGAQKIRISIFQIKQIVQREQHTH